MASEMATKASEANGQFFKLAPAWNWVSVIAVITIIEISVYQPNLLPCDSLGYLGERFCHMVEKYHSTLEIGFWILIFIHVLEAIYAGQVCRELNLETKAKIKWMLQTFVVGMFSLKFLIKERKHIKQN